MKKRKRDVENGCVAYKSIAAYHNKDVHRRTFSINSLFEYDLYTLKILKHIYLLVLF